MHSLLLLIALLWIVAGAFLILNTAQTREWLAKQASPERIRGLAVIPLGVGAFLLFGAFSLDRLFWWAFLIGAAALAKGVYFLRASPARATSLTEAWLLRPEERTLRLWGIVALVLGAALLARVVG